MAIPSLDAELEAATSLLDLARRLGRVCLEEEAKLMSLRNMNDELRSHRLYLERAVASIDPAEWQPRPGVGFGHITRKHGLDSFIGRMSMHHPLEYLAFVRGLCDGALTGFFERTEHQIPLARGLPIPFAKRPIHALFDATPSQEKIGSRDLLAPTGYEFFRHQRNDYVSATLDFGHRDRLDAITWSAKRQLPTVATLHPLLDHEHIDFTVSGDTFFDVKPKRWSLEDVLAWLRSVGELEIAVLPELCLPTPDALSTSLAEAPSEYPALVVAGSAHVRHTDGDKTINANESHVYLDGQLVHVHRKVHPLHVDKLGDRRFERALSEELTPEPKELVILSGEHTRLAVVICADLNEAPIPTLLEAAGVNLLLAPSLTYSAGAFNGAICGLASRCQAVCVVVNACLDEFTDKDGNKRQPFLVLASAPRPEPQEQSMSYRHPSDTPPPRGAFDPNRTLDRAMTWS
jgi:hypothetical protein